MLGGSFQRDTERITYEVNMGFQRKSKYGATKCKSTDGIMFDSKKERDRWEELRVMQKRGKITDLRRQVSFELIPNQRGEDGKIVERAIKYIADFVYTKDGQDVVEDVKAYFEEFSEKAEHYGIRNWVLDPGIGFAKTIEQNYELLRRLDAFKELADSPRILIGVSRKSLIYKYFNISPAESLPATQVLGYAALTKGADILRVHDVAEAVRTVALYRMLA